MKKNVLKSMKSVVIAATLCAGLVLGIFSIVSASPCDNTPSVAAFCPWFIDGAY